jgi:hypothetical protein
MNNRLAAILVVALVVAGCSRGEPDGAAGDVAARAPAAPGADVVAGVLQSSGTPVAKLGFVLGPKPAIGIQSSLRLDISAAAPVPTLQLVAEPDGLALDPATARSTLALAAGKVVSHELLFTPEREGLSEITVRLRSGEEGSETIYAIPVLVEKPAAGG